MAAPYLQGKCSKPYNCLEKLRIQRGLNSPAMDYPATYKYTKEHEWIELSGKEGKVGITDYAQNSLGDIVFVDLPKVGSSVEKGKVFGSVESVKAVSDLYSPVSGKVTAVNEELTGSPEKINTDAHSSWIMKVEVANAADASDLLSKDQYETYIKEETH
jgi:glycine cleavage system H protein